MMLTREQMMGGVVALVATSALMAMHTSAPAAELTRPSAVESGDSSYVRDHYTKHEFGIPTRDGVELFTAVYVPNDASPEHRYPIVMLRTPFSVAPYGPTAYPPMLGPDRFMLRDGYIFVSQDVRGRYMSGGTFENVRPLLPDSVKANDPGATDEATDTYDTIAWLLTHIADNNGRVGLWGISYPGFYATLGLVSRHPALVAVSPQAPGTDCYFDDFHHNGALTQGYFTSYPVFGIPRPAPTTDTWWLPAFQKLLTLVQEDDYQWQLSLGPISTFGEQFYPGNTLWNDIVAHPDYDEFWQARAPESRLRDVTAAVLVVGGWFDGEDLHGPLSVYQTLRRYNPTATTSLVMGPFGHRGWASIDDGPSVVDNLVYGDSLALQYQRDIEAPFFRAHLKVDRDVPAASAHIFDTGQGRWVELANWPSAAAVGENYFLHADGSMSTDAPTGFGSFREYISDPAHPVPTRCSGPVISDYSLYMNDDQRCFTTRGDVLTFETAPLTRDVTVSGPITAHLQVSTTGTDADFVVKLIDVYPAEAPDDADEAIAGVHLAGYQALVRGEILRGRYRASFTRPEPFVPGQVTAVNVPLPDVLHTFRKGHRIMVQVQSSWFPMFERNPQSFSPNIYRAPAGAFVQATQRVWLSRQAPSSIVLPVMP